jgi:hypothetical protein
MTLKSTIRSMLYQAEKLSQRARFPSAPNLGGEYPVLLGISFPKSGTHLLDQILLGFSNIAPFSKRLHSFYAEYDGDSRWTGLIRSALVTLPPPIFLLGPSRLSASHPRDLCLILFFATRAM